MLKKPFMWITTCYFLLNLLNTYFLTSPLLNQYIVAFEDTFFSHLFSICGNLAILSAFFLLGVVLFKKEKNISLYLMILTLVLNFAVIALQYYNKSYRLAFSLFNFNLYKNPTGGFGANVFLDWVVELFIYFRIVCLIPFAVLLTLFLIFKKQFNPTAIRLPWKKTLIYVLMIVFIQTGTYLYYRQSLKENWKYSTDYAQYGCQYAGVYNYYIGEFLFHIDNRNPLNDGQTQESTYQELDPFNKNVDQYVNLIDQKTYSKYDRQTGVCKDMNVFVIQMESTMSFAFQNTFNGIEVTPYLNRLFEEDNCFYFNHVYTNVGVGNTSDAEFSFFTGFYPTGDMTIVWEYDEYDFDLPTLGTYLDGYTSNSYNGTDEIFYNHDFVHENLYRMTHFQGLDTFIQLYPKDDYEDKYLDYWIRDDAILEWATKKAQDLIREGNKSFSFVETITPHNPYPDFSDELPDFEKVDFNLNITHYILENYLNQVRYNDRLLYEFLMEASDPTSPNYMENTLFLLYGDHGASIKKEEFDDLYDRKLSDLEFRKIALNIPLIIYDPSGNIYRSMDQEEIPDILSQVKSLADIHRTLINLLGIDTDAKYFGVNVFSGEPSFAYDPKNYDILTDDFIYNRKNNTFISYALKEIDLTLLEKISNYRLLQDNYLNVTVYGAKKRRK